jgi:hypothetical protein
MPHKKKKGKKKRKKEKKGIKFNAAKFKSGINLCCLFTSGTIKLQNWCRLIQKGIN